MSIVSYRTDETLLSRAVPLILDTRSPIHRVNRVNNPGKQERCSTSKDPRENQIGNLDIIGKLGTQRQ